MIIHLESICLFLGFFMYAFLSLWISGSISHHLPLTYNVLALFASKFVNNTNRCCKLFTALKAPTLYNLQTKSAFPSSMGLGYTWFASFFPFLFFVSTCKHRTLLCRYPDLPQSRLNVICSATLDFNDI